MQCNVPVTRTNTGQKCADCNKSCHTACMKISNNEKDSIIMGTVAYRCETCCFEKSTSGQPINASDSDDESSSSSLKLTIMHMSKEISVIKQRQAEFNKSIDSLIRGFNDIKSIAEKLDDQNRRIKQLEREKNEVQRELSIFKDRFETLEDNSLCTLIEIRNVPTTKSENLLDLLKKIHDEINLPLSDGEFTKAYRSRKPTNDNTHPPIVVKYSSEFFRDRVLSAFKVKRDITVKNLGFAGDTKIFINEFLSKTKRQLFYKAKLFKAERNFKYLWVKNGKIYLKENDDSKRFLVKNQNVFDLIIKKISK